jgi:hypothetical protein
VIILSRTNCRSLLALAVAPLEGGHFCFSSEICSSMVFSRTGSSLSKVLTKTRKDESASFGVRTLSSSLDLGSTNIRLVHFNG